MRIWIYSRWLVRDGLRRISDLWRGWAPVSHSENYFRTVVEPAVDGFHVNSPLLKLDRDNALIHLLRCFEDASRIGTMRAIPGGDLRFYRALRYAHEGLPWATRWLWDKCPSAGESNLELDWEKYEQAGKMLRHSYDYYHLYRCFVLYSKRHFDALIDRSRHRIRFLWNSKDEMRRDAARQVRENINDS